MSRKPTYEALEKRIADLERRNAQLTAAAKKSETLLEDALAEKSFRQGEITAILEAARSIPLCETFEESARTIFDACRMMIGARSGYVALLSENGKENEVLFLESGGMPCDVDPELPMPVRGLREVAYKTRKAAYENHFGESRWMQYMPAGHVELANVLFAPLNIDDRTVGIIGIANKPQAFDEKDAQLAMAFGDLAAVALMYAKSQASLRAGEKKFRLAAEAAHFGVWDLDVKDNRLEWDDWMFRLYGVDRDDFSGTYEMWQACVHPDDLERSSKELERALLGEAAFDTAFRIVRPDGAVRHIKAHATVSYDSQGKPVHLTGVNYDITDHVKAKTALEESEARFRALHNASFGGIAIHDKGVILECNNGLSEMTGYTYDELIGMNGLGLISDDTRDWVVGNIEAGYEKPYEAKGVRKNGEIYPLRLEARNIPYKGKTVRVVEFRDLTETKRAEKEKEALEARLRQAQKMEAVGRLAGGVAHDFNNMLSVIIGRADMALEEMDPSSPLYAHLEEIGKAGERSADLTRQLLAFARKQTVAPKVLDLNDTVAGMIKMLQRLIGEDVELAWIPGDKVWPVKVDPCQIDQILANLCVNARDAIADVGKVTIETGNVVLDAAHGADHPGFVPGEYVCLSVSDDGCGMDKETLSNIFEPFFTTKDAGKGTGLGLATVYGVVKQNKGFINVRSEPGQGTTFRIHLPRHLTRTADISKKRSERAVEHGHETVLLVEDEPAILRMTRMMLEKLGYTVVAARTPGEAVALSQAHAEDIHLLLTDVIMPEMNGRDLAETILSFHPHMKCLFMSGYTADVIAHRGVLDEGVDFIQKPFSRADLGLKLRETLKKSGDKIVECLRRSNQRGATGKTHV